MLRLFISVDLKDQLILQQIDEVTQEIEQLKAVRVVNPALLHFTLKFLGDTPENKISIINKALSTIQWSSFNLTLQGVGVFPKPSFPRILWIGVSAGQHSIKKLAQEVDQALGKVGFPREKRPFSPHLTIGRFKSKNFSREFFFQLLKDYQDVKFGQFPIQQVNLKKSTLTPKGPIYETVSSFPASSVSSEED